MLSTTTELETLTLEFPLNLSLYVTPEQFEAIALANRKLRLERTAQGELYRFAEVKRQKSKGKSLVQ